MSANFTNSLSVDKRLFRQEIRASIAHCDGLFRAGIVTRLEAEQLKNGLWTILKRADFDAHYFAGISAPDIFTFIEARLYQLINQAAFQLKIGRSQPYRTVTAFRLWLREETELILEKFDNLQEHLHKFQNEEFFAALINGFSRDEARFREVLAAVNKMPRPPFHPTDETVAEIDFYLIARELGFAAVIENSYDSIQNKDFCADFSNACIVAMLHLSHLSDALATQAATDSFHQQISRTIRGKTSRVIGNQAALLNLLSQQSFFAADEQIEVCALIFETTDILNASLQAVVHQ